MGYLFLVVFVVMVGSTAAWLAMILFNRDRIGRLDEITMGHRVVVDAFPYTILRATDYAFACTFDLPARRAHPGVDFASIPRELKRPFQIMCVLQLLALFCLVAGSAWALLG